MMIIYDLPVSSFIPVNVVCAQKKMCQAEQARITVIASFAKKRGAIVPEILRKDNMVLGQGKVTSVSRGRVVRARQTWKCTFLNSHVLRTDTLTITILPSTTTVSCKVDTAHTDIIHDAQLNFFGNRLATCSSDRIVKIFEVKANGYIVPIAELAGHSAPVWQVSWAHPDFGGLLASAGYDRKVIIWSENNGRWQKSHEWTGHEASVNSVSFAPHQLGLLLATASADSSIGILEFNPQSAQWVESRITKAHEQGVNAVSWCPVQRVVGDAGDRPYTKRLASCGNDNLVKIWVVDEKGEWTVEKSLAGHTDFVRDVAWCPVVNHSSYTIASCGLAQGALWHVSWSVCGSILSVSGEDNKVYQFCSARYRAHHTAGFSETGEPMDYQHGYSINHLSTGCVKPSSVSLKLIEISVITSGAKQIVLWRENLQGQWQKMDDSNGK